MQFSCFLFFVLVLLLRIRCFIVRWVFVLYIRIDIFRLGATELIVSFGTSFADVNVTRISLQKKTFSFIHIHRSLFLWVASASLFPSPLFFIYNNNRFNIFVHLYKGIDDVNHEYLYHTFSILMLFLLFLHAHRIP